MLEYKRYEDIRYRWMLEILCYQVVELPPINSVEKDTNLQERSLRRVDFIFLELFNGLSGN